MIDAAKVLDSDVTSKEINEMAEWLEGLNFQQLMFLKKSYEEMLQAQARACNQEYIQ